MDLIQEKIETFRRAHRENNTIEKKIGDFHAKVGVIINFLNHIPKEEVIEENIDRSRWVARSN